MVSFMHCCTRKINIKQYVYAALIMLWSMPFLAYADGIVVRKAEIRLEEDGYQLAANFDIKLTSVVEQALVHGITLNFVSEFSLTRSRWYWFDEEKSKTEETTKLSYSALTQQYRIKRGTLFQNFSNLEDALRALGNQYSNSMPVELLNKSSGYIASLITFHPKYTAYARMKLDVSQLPKPLQVNAITSDEWQLDSDGYSWLLAPEEIAQARNLQP
jgi:Domain of unknown function (DUF4390)